MNFKTTLYNRQIDLMKFDRDQGWHDKKTECEIHWKIVEDQKDSGVTIAWFAIEAHLKVIELIEGGEDGKNMIYEHIHFDNGWSIEFEESELRRGEYFQPTGIVIQCDEKKVFCTLIRQEGDGLPF